MLIPFLHSVVRRQLRHHGVESKQIRLGQQAVHYFELSPPKPEGTLVLVHGLGTSSSTWVNILPHIKKFHVFAPDLPGFGFSPSPRTIPTIGDYSRVLDAFIDAVSPGPAKLLGHSMGGWITMKYTIDHRDRVNHLILVNTAGIYYQGVDELQRAFVLRSSKDTRKLLDRIWIQYPWYFRPFTYLVFEDLVRRRVPEIVQTIEMNDFVNSDLHKLTMPVTVIWGLGDKLISRDSLRILEDKLPARRVYTIRDSGHVPQLQTPEEFLGILTMALEETTL